MNSKRLEELLKENESIYLEFKEGLDLAGNSGKAKFVREVLSLANSPIRVGYLILGIEDQTNRLVGVDGITEETVQQIVAEWCTPPIKFGFQLVEHQGKKLGVMQIYPVHPPYTLKKSTSYDEPTDDPKNKRKQVNLRTNQVFLRRGSIIAEAEVEEIIEMAQREVSDLSDVIAELKGMTENLDEIAFTAREFRYKLTEDEYSSSLETALVGMLSGLVLAWVWSGAEIWAPLLGWPVSFFVIALTASMKWTHFSIWRACFVSFFMGTLIGLLFLGGSRFVAPAVFVEPVPRIGFGLISGAISGIIASNSFEKFRIAGRG